MSCDRETCREGRLIDRGVGLDSETGSDRGWFYTRARNLGLPVQNVNSLEYDFNVFIL